MALSSVSVIGNALRLNAARLAASSTGFSTVMARLGQFGRP
jgi:hypothetical protein